MKNNTSRRLFLRNTAIATTGMAFLSSSTVLHALTNEESPFKGYNPYAEEKTDLRTTILGEQLRVKGVLYEKSSMKPLENASIEVWHLSPNSTKYKHRGKLRTNEAGEYNFITDYPNHEIDKVPRVYFKVTHSGDEVFTDLVLNKTGAHISDNHWEANKHLGDKLFPTSEKNLNTSIINYNLSI
jgi:hypothetical protein